MKGILDLTKIVLVEPAGAINVGSVARLCRNFGIKDLRLVSPRCNHLDQEATKMAVRGKDLLKKAKIFPSLLDAISDCNWVIATCGRKDHGDIPISNSEESLNWLNTASKKLPAAIVFGREDHGLTNNELLLTNKVISLGTDPDYPSLNLSHSVAIVLYELSRLNGLGLKEKRKQRYNPANPKQVEECLKDTKDLLLEIGFLMNHTTNARMNKIKKLLQRSEIRAEEVALIRGIVSQTKWFIRKNKS